MLSWEGSETAGCIVLKFFAWFGVMHCIQASHTSHWWQRDCVSFGASLCGPSLIAQRCFDGLISFFLLKGHLSSFSFYCCSLPCRPNGFMTTFLPSRTVTNRDSYCSVTLCPGDWKVQMGKWKAWEIRHSGPILLTLKQVAVFKFAITIPKHANFDTTLISFKHSSH